MKLLKSAQLTLGFGLAALAGSPSAAPTLQQFFSPALFKDAQISPSGRYLAMKVQGPTQRDSLIVVDSDTGSLIGGARRESYDIGSVRWVNDNRLVYTLQDHTLAPGDKRWWPGLHAIDRDGSNHHHLVAHQFQGAQYYGTRIQLPNTFLSAQPGAQDSEFIFAQRPILDKFYRPTGDIAMVRLNTSDATTTWVTSPAFPREWLLDHKGHPSVMTSMQNGKQAIFWREPGVMWRQLAEFPAYSEEGGGLFEPVGFMDDKHLLVKARSKDSDKIALYRLDLAMSKLDPAPLVALGDFDFNGTMVYSNQRLVGIHYVGDARDTAWFDADMKAAQTAVDKILPGLINIITPPSAPEVPWLLVQTYSDRQPITYSLFNSKTGVLKLVGASHPDIKPSEMGRQTLSKIKARDGMDVPVWLTLPADGRKKLPLVVRVHGGPYARGTEFGWDPVSQFLVSRGYAVLEPEFRGSTGYGQKLFAAGMKQWGLAMQDDIADSVKWAVEQGHADPERICLLGASYGGYATMMGLIKDPDLYRCGVAYAAVADIPLWLDEGVKSDVSQEYRKYGAPVLLGDAQADAGRFTATSPLQQAARIKRPLLLAHGTDDHRVPFVHFIKMRRALKSNKANAEFVEYEREGHGWSTMETQLDFWSRVEKFLDKHIGQGSKAQ